jgi:hypothetical protein
MTTVSPHVVAVPWGSHGSLVWTTRSGVGGGGGLCVRRWEGELALQMPFGAWAHGIHWRWHWNRISTSPKPQRAAQ